MFDPNELDAKIAKSHINVKKEEGEAKSKRIPAKEANNQSFTR